MWVVAHDEKYSQKTKAKARAEAAELFAGNYKELERKERGADQEQLAIASICTAHTIEDVNERLKRYKNGLELFEKHPNLQNLSVDSLCHYRDGATSLAGLSNNLGDIDSAIRYQKMALTINESIKPAIPEASAQLKIGLNIFTNLRKNSQRKVPN